MTPLYQLMTRLSANQIHSVLDLLEKGVSIRQVVQRMGSIELANVDQRRLN